MPNYANGPEVPMGLGMALAEDVQAMQYFASLSPQERQSIISQTHTITSKEEMRQFVKNFSGAPHFF